MLEKIIYTCPNCGKELEWSEKNPFRPFCSDRCRLIDLGAWANEEYKITQDPNEPKHNLDESSVNEKWHE